MSTDREREALHMLTGAAEVIRRRTLRMALGQMTAPEAAGMVSEKVVAFSLGGALAALALSRGADPFAAALGPIAARVAANVETYRKV